MDQSKAIGGECARRDKYWSELDDAGKIERMHGVVLSLRSQLDQSQQELHSLRQHQHAADGALMVPLQEFGYGSSIGSSNRIGGPQQAYF